jgi:hypothetical protein
MVQASRLYARRHAPVGVVGNSETGEMRLQEKPVGALAVLRSRRGGAGMRRCAPGTQV